MRVQRKDLTTGVLHGIDLDPGRDFIFTGGQASVYGRDGVAYKIFTDRNTVIPEAKIRELSQLLVRPNILAPRQMLQDQKGRDIGFTMKLASDCHPLCKLFGNDFRTRNAIDQQKATKLVLAMAQDIRFIHSKRCLIVDGNEMNYLVSADFTTPVFIDVDSWQTPGFAASAQSPAIRDFHTHGYSELTDWFAFAVVVTQIFMGIHPYKGRHPAYAVNDFVARMKDNMSVFNSEVSCPPVVRSADTIPESYRDWLFRVLEKGEREPPPLQAGPLKVRAPRIKQQLAGQLFDLELYCDLTLPVARVSAGYVMTADGVYSLQGKLRHRVQEDVELVRSDIVGSDVMAFLQDGRLVLQRLHDAAVIDNSLAAEAMMVSGDTVYVKSGARLDAVRVRDLGSTSVADIKLACDLLPQASRLFPGMVSQPALNRHFLMFPLPAGGIAQVSIPELEGYQVVEAKQEGGVAWLLAAQGGRYDSFTFKFSSDFATYQVVRQQDVTYQSPNFTVLPNGTCLLLTLDGELQLFSARPDRPDIISRRDPAVGSDFTLSHHGTTVLAYRDQQLYRISTRK